MEKLNKFEMGLIVVASLLSVISLVVYESVDMLGLVAVITGVICVVMTAKGHISCYYYGIVNIVAYIIIGYSASLYGEVMLNGIYYLPMQFVGIYFWKKNMHKEEQIVKVASLKKWEYFVYPLISLFAIGGYAYFLNNIGGNQPLVDSSTTILSCVAMYLSVKRLKEQWFIWIFVNILSIYMWSVALVDGYANSLLMILMWSAYLVNAFYGYFNWTKLEKRG